MTTAHTPGPWHYKHDDYAKNAINVEAEGHVPICRLTGTASAHNDGEANARLIAAAPELLAALKTLQLWPNQNCWCPLERAGAHRAGTKIHTTGCLKARAAIAKAEGR